MSKNRREKGEREQNSPQVILIWEKDSLLQMEFLEEKIFKTNIRNRIQIMQIRVSYGLKSGQIMF